MTYTPKAADYQQLPSQSGDPIGGFGCTAYSAAWLVDAASGGKIKVTGAQVRKATDEPKPDPKSPGLNLPQVDAAVQKITPFDFDTRLGYPIAKAQARIEAGQWAEVQVMRGVLVDRGMGGASPFRDGHAVTVHPRPEDLLPLGGDPLVDHYIAYSWPALWAAAGLIAGAGKVNVMFTRDLLPSYEATIRPTPPHKRREFNVFHVKNGVIVRREQDVTTGFSVRCSPPKWHRWPGPRQGRSLVKLLEGKREGLYVRSDWADET